MFGEPSELSACDFMADQAEPLVGRDLMLPGTSASASELSWLDGGGAVGVADGLGVAVGATVAVAVGFGVALGASVGVAVGAEVGASVGVAVGASVGAPVG